MGRAAGSGQRFPATLGRTRAGVPGAGRALAKRRLRACPRWRPEGAGWARRLKCRRGEVRPGPLRAALPLLVGEVGRPGWARAKFYKHLVSPGVQVGEARGDRLGAGAATRRGAAGALEKPPSADKEVLPPGNDLRDPRSAPGGPQPRSTVCRLDGFLLNAWGALGLPRPRRAGMLAEGLRKTPGAERLAGEEEKRDATGKIGRATRLNSSHRIASRMPSSA